MSEDALTSPEFDSPVSMAEMRSVTNRQSALRLVPGQVQALAELGRSTIQAGELDFCLGVLTDQIENLRDGQRLATMIYENSESGVREKILVLDRRGKLAVAITNAVSELREISKLSGERKSASRNKSQSFTPNQIVQVNVQAQPVGEPTTVSVKEIIQ